ncbi:aldo/keto reductase [Flavihumibacter sp. R14]|nr:aldo/keto reductase [Flavihumibacter soli]
MLNQENQEGRRQFLKIGAFLGTAAIAAPVLAAAQLEKEVFPENKNDGITKTRILGSGKHSLNVSALGLGCMGMSWNRSFVPDRKNSISVIRKAYEMGVNFFDTAEAYGPFANEELVGEAIAPFRKDIILCSKFGFDIQNNKLTGGFNSDPKHIRQVVDQSLKRLKTDVIDLLYQHRVDPKIPMEDVAGAVKDLIEQGKVKNFGLSEAGAESIRKAHAIQPLTAIQTELSLMSREAITEIFPVCEELGIGFVPYSPLCRAYLTGYLNERTKFDPANDNRPSLPRYTPEAIRANWKIVEFLTDFGNQRGLTPAQISLAWLLALKPYVVPIPGTTKLAHLQENMLSADITLSKAELDNITQTITGIRIVGDRYAAPQTK